MYQGRIFCWILPFVLLFFLLLGSYPLAEPDEARNGEIVREMVEEGRWIPPTLNGQVRYQKPPLYYWILGLAAKVWGLGEFSIRFLSAFSAFVLVLLLVLWGERLFHNGAISALVFASFPLVFVYSKVARMEMFFTALVSLSVYFSWRALRSDEMLSWILSSLFAALAFLTKGPVVFVFLFSAIVPYMLVVKVLNLRRVLLWFLFFFLVVTPIFFALERFSPGYCYAFFWKENVLRYLTPMFHRQKPWYYFILVLLLGAFPWTALALKKGWDTLLLYDELFLLFGWVFIPLVFFSLSKSKLPHYILPSFPGLALLIGGILSDVSERWLRKVLAPLFVAYLLCVIFAFPLYANHKSYKKLALNMLKTDSTAKILIYKDKLFSLSYYTGRVVPRVRGNRVKELVSQKETFWLVLKIKRLKDVPALGACIIKKRFEQRDFVALLIDC